MSTDITDRINDLTKDVSKMTIKKSKDIKKSDIEKKVKKTPKLSSDVKKTSDDKPKDNILCGFPLITKPGEKCSSKGLKECGGRCKRHDGK